MAGQTALIPATSLSLEWVRPPQQARSQRTMARLLDAAEELVEERGFGGLTVSAVVARAGSSVGAFYARFGDKENLIRCLFDRFYEQADATSAAALDPERWRAAGLYDAMLATVLFVVEVFRQRRELISGLTTRGLDTEAGGGPAAVLSERIAERLLALALDRGETIHHPDPKRAVHTCVWMVLAAMSSWALAGARDGSLPDQAGFAGDVTDMCFRFLFQAR